MPKAAKRKTKEPGHARNEPPKPYERTDSLATVTKALSQPSTSSHANRNAHSPPVSPKNASQPLPESGRAKRRRGKKDKQRERRAQEGATATFLHTTAEPVTKAARFIEVNGASSRGPVDTTLFSDGKADADIAESREEALRRQVFGEGRPRVNGAHNKYEMEAKELRKKVASMAKAEEDACKNAAELRRRVEELEKTVATQQADMEKTQAEIEVKEKLIHDHGNHSDSLKEHLLCGVCFEALDDPHILSCGHCACRGCLQDWFRSPNAYPAADIEVVTEDDDLTFRTKVCHMCRERIFRRPTRMFIMQQMVEIVGLPRGTAVAGSQPRDQDPWNKVFPPEPKTWLVRDEDDNVSRCPQCGCEVDFGECEQCGATFSVTGSDLDRSEGDLFMDRVDLGNGLMMDNQHELEAQLADNGPHLVALRAQLHAPEPEANAYIDRLMRNHGRHLRLLQQMGDNPYLDDEADVDDEAGVDDEADLDDGYNARLMGLLGNVADDNDDSMDTDYDSGSEFWGGREELSDLDDEDVINQDDVHSGREDDVNLPEYWGPDPVRIHRPRRRHHEPTPIDLMSDGSYESSFINDDASDDAIDALDASNDAGVQSDVDELAGDGSGADEPSIEELRQRRAARYGAAPRAYSSPSEASNTSRDMPFSPAPYPGRRRRARNYSPARSSSIEPLGQEPVPRARALPRRIRVIDSDDDE